MKLRDSERKLKVSKGQRQSRGSYSARHGHGSKLFLREANAEA